MTSRDQRTRSPGGPLSHLSVEPGRLFLDDRGEVAQLHGVGMMRIGDRFWAWGENKDDRFPNRVDAYSSPDLASWRFEGAALVGDHAELAPDRVVERPKVVQDPTTGQYVMLIHIDSADYSDARVGFAVAASPAGPFKYLNSVRPLGHVSRDIGVFQENGTTYLFSEERNAGLNVFRLSPDCLDIEKLVTTIPATGIADGVESPAVAHVGDLYYLFGSRLTGWSLNDNVYCCAPRLGGPWSEWRTFAPVGSNTFESQVSCVVEASTSNGLEHVYVGDRWRPDDLAASEPVWLPLRLGFGRACLEWSDRWQLAGDAASGAKAIPDRR